jgi:hypothetical protein
VQETTPDVTDEESFGVVPPESVQEDSTFHEEFDLEAEERSEGVEIEQDQDTLKSGTESEIERSKPSTEIEETLEEEAEELPRTAGELPLLGLLGLVCLGAGLAARTASARS